MKPATFVVVLVVVVVIEDQHDYDYDNDNEHRFAEYARDRRTSIGGCQSNIHPLKTR
ncbi:MAG: hypothetical protein JRJ60_18350 [Deltaproteobacteria bacterium]|nr:hypothetical protein [Deltaproteobacteria bacterium]